MLLIRQRGGALAVPLLQQFHGTANYPPKPVIIAMTRTYAAAVLLAEFY